MTSGYSKKPLIQKLGMKENSRVLFVNPPEGYIDSLGELPPDSSISTSPPYDFVHFFAASQAELRERLPELKDQIKSDGMIWVSWPKKSSDVQSDLSEDEIRRAAFPCHLVDVKVCAVDEIWSGLKLVIRVEHR